MVPSIEMCKHSLLPRFPCGIESIEKVLNFKIGFENLEKVLKLAKICIKY